MSKPVSLSDEQLTAVMSAAEPLAPIDRAQFLRALADALRSEPGEIGDGTVAKAIRSLQRQYFRPPTSTSGPQSHRVVGPALE
jgi:hypothetical protein